MNFRILLYPALHIATVLGMVGCKYAEQERPGSLLQGKEQTVMASLEQPVVTKTSLSAQRKVLWSPGDKIKVFNAANPEGVEYTLSQGEGTAMGSFTGAALSGEGPFWAVYPASVAGTLQGSSVSITLPAHQAYAEGSFGPGAAVSMAKAADLSSLSFKNVLGGVSFSISGSQTLSGIQLQAKGGEALCGKGTLSMDGETPTLTLDASEEGSFLYLDGPGTASGSFCLMLPPGVFENGFMAQFLDSEGSVLFRGAKAGVNRVQRSLIIEMPASAYTPAYKASFFQTNSFGVYRGVGASQTLDSALSYDSASCQYAFRQDEEGRYVRVQSLSKGFYAESKTPAVLPLGETVEASVTTVVNTGVGTEQNTFTGTFKVLQKTADRVWLVNEDQHLGIIQKMED